MTGTTTNPKVNKHHPDLTGEHFLWRFIATDIFFGFSNNMDC